MSNAILPSSSLAQFPLQKRISCRRILFCTDFSTYSEAALPYASAIATKYASTLIVTHVINNKQSPFFGRAEMEKAQEGAEQSLAKVIASLPTVPCEVRLLKGDVWLSLSELIEREKIDLVVIGTHGHRGVITLALGSVAEQVFRLAPCPSSVSVRGMSWIRRASCRCKRSFMPPILQKNLSPRPPLQSRWQKKIRRICHCYM